MGRMRTVPTAPEPVRRIGTDGLFRLENLCVCYNSTPAVQDVYRLFLEIDVGEPKRKVAV